MNFSVDNSGDDQPSSQLDIYHEAITPQVQDELLSESNLGLGNYDDAEMWQQVESFRDGIFADEAFGRILTDRAIDETKRELALEGFRFEFGEDDLEDIDEDGWTDLDDEERDRRDRRRYIEERGEQIWGALPEELRYRTLVEVTGFEKQWIPPHWRMLMMRHEASRSRDARTLDNVFGRVSRIEKDDTSDVPDSRLDKLRGDN